jgi:hypothetical protein
MAARLGCVTGLGGCCNNSVVPDGILTERRLIDLAQHCRLLLHSRPKHKLLFRRVLLYPMYVVCEIGIIATDLAEVNKHEFWSGQQSNHGFIFTAPR